MALSLRSCFFQNQSGDWETRRRQNGRQEENVKGLRKRRSRLSKPRATLFRIMAGTTSYILTPAKVTTRLSIISRRAAPIQRKSAILFRRLWTRSQLTTSTTFRGTARRQILNPTDSYIQIADAAVIVAIFELTEELRLMTLHKVCQDRRSKIHASC